MYRFYVANTVKKMVGIRSTCPGSVYQWKIVFCVLLFLNGILVYKSVGDTKISSIQKRKGTGYERLKNMKPDRYVSHNPRLNKNIAPKNNSKYYIIGNHGHNCSRLRQSIDRLKNRSHQEILSTYETDNRGRWLPTSCIPKQKTVIVIPYRDRSDHLRKFIDHHIPIFQRQLLDFTIVVVEQDFSQNFNRGMLFNIGYKEALSLTSGNPAPLCLILHDVDLLLENDRLIYECTQFPTHLSVAIDKYEYRLPYKWLYGGVVALLSNQFEESNGFGNLFFGWGGEDDDFRERLLFNGLFPVQYENASDARYSMIVHGESKNKNDARANLYYGDNIAQRGFIPDIGNILYQD